MKRLISIVLVALMLTAMSIYAMPIESGNLPALLADNSIETTRNLEVPVDIKIDANDSGTYVDGPINKDYDADGTAVGYKATIFMNDVRSKYTAYMRAASLLVAGMPDMETALANCRITGTFTIKITYPESANIPTAMLTGTALYGFSAEAANAFVETEPRTVSTSANGSKELTITISLKTPYIVVSDMTAHLDTYLPDFSVTCDNVLLFKIGENKITGTLAGQTIIKDTQDRLVGTINYTGKQGNASGVTGGDISEIVNIAAPGGIVVYPPSSGSSDKDTPPKQTHLDVESENTTIEVDSSQLTNIETVGSTTKTESGTQVSANVNIKNSNVGSIALSTNDTQTSAIGSAADNMIGTPFTINATAKDNKGNDIENVVLNNVKVASEGESYAYIVDEYGVPTRTESTYDPTTGTVMIAEVPSGATIMLSSQEPVIFTDTVDHWAENDVNYIADMGLVNGKGQKTYDPNASLTRAEQAKIIGNVAGLANIDIKEPTDEQKIDTDESHWAIKELKTALANNWLKGTSFSNGVVEMSADENITREQFVTTIWRLLGSPKSEKQDMSKFIDKENLSDYSGEAFDWAIANGLINGVAAGDNKFLLNPGKDITRAESAKIYRQVIRLLKDFKN